MTDSQNTPGLPAVFPWHEAEWRHFSDMLSHGRLPHALLLAGPKGVGKVSFAHRLACAMVCEHTSPSERPCGYCKACRLAASGTHPDIHWLEPEEEGKSIRIDAVRELIGRSTLTTQAQGMRVFGISPAEAMNRAAANALLKTLEEPVPSSCLVLVSSAPHRLPATILSRCQKLTFRPVDRALAMAWMADQGMDESAEETLSLAGGAPLLAQQFEIRGRVAEINDMVENMLALKNRKVNPISIAAGWAEQGVQDVLDGLKRIVSDLIQLSVATQESPRLFLELSQGDLKLLINNMNLQDLFKFMDELYQLERQMGHNLNPQMLIERLTNNWLSITRPEKC